MIDLPSSILNFQCIDVSSILFPFCLLVQVIVNFSSSSQIEYHYVSFEKDGKHKGNRRKGHSEKIVVTIVIV